MGWKFVTRRHGGNVKAERGGEGRGGEGHLVWREGGGESGESKAGLLMREDASECREEWEKVDRGGR